jgi:type I restriction enzyme S subunit
MSWECVRLGEFLTLKRGYDLPAARRAEGDVPVVSSSGITGHHNVAKVAGPGVVTGRYGTLGEIFFVQEDFWPLNTALYVEDFKGNHPRFSAYLLQTILSATSSDKAAVPGVNRNDLHARKVTVTRDTHEQGAIADLLSTYDDLIENNRRRIQLLEDAARLLYKEWFVHLRFPGHGHVTIVDGVPEGWSSASLGDIASLKYGKALKKDDRVPGPFAVYGSSGVVGTHHQALVSGPTIILGRKGNVGSVYWTQDDCYPIDTVYYIDSKAASLYFYYALVNTTFISTDVAVPGLNRDFAQSRRILIPEQTIRRVFEDLVSPVHRQIYSLSRHSRALQQARDILLPRLMNGEMVA